MKKSIIFVTLICVMALSLCGSASAANQTVITVNNNVNLTVANDNGTRFNDYPTGTNINNTYNFFNPNQGAGQGLNAFYITTSNTTTQGGVYNVNNSVGTFYLSDTGGRGWDDDGILMIAINGTIPDDFSITITASGYTWTPVPTGSYPAYSNVTYNPVTLNETFYKSDFIYGPQIWRPAPGSGNYYPIFNNQNMGDTNNRFSIMFVDLYSGILGTGTMSQGNGFKEAVANGLVTDNGMIKVKYIINNLPKGSILAFDGYAYTVSSNQGQGIRWTNRLSASGSSGYTVNGQSPIANFTANPKNGSAPLNVQFTDASTGTGSLTYLWNFGDGSTSTEQNPTHTYTKPGTYTVTLTASNAAGNNTVTKTSYITVLKSDVYVNIIPSNSNPQVGDIVTYKFKLGNNGPGIAKDVVFTYTIPEGLEYEGAIVDQGNMTYNATTRTLTWNLGDVAVGDPNLWLQLKVLTAGNYNIQPTVTVGGTTLESNISSLQVNAASPTTETVNAASTTKTVPMQTTGMPIAGLVSALIMIGSGIAISRKK